MVNDTQAGFFRKTTNILSSLATLFPSRLCIIDHAFPSRDAYRAWLIEGGFRDHFSDKRAKSHTSSPFVWRSSSLLRLPPEDESKVIEFVGGHDDSIMRCRTFFVPTREKIFNSNKIMLEDGYNSKHPYEYDLVVIGGGSGGLAASKEASNRGAGKVVLLDYVKPTPIGSTWGLGGTCVNVGCIPKKLMHQASILGENLKDAKEFGWQISEGSEGTHQWEKMVENVQGHIKGLNWGYKTQLRSQSVKYFNELASFTGPNTIKATNKKGEEKSVTAAKFILATGGRPVYPEIEGAKEFGITSDDIFSMPTDPGKTLLVGASYISLENAGFLSGMGKNVTIMVRSILLRGFDQQIAEKIGEHMEKKCGINFIRQCVPTKLEKVGDGEQKGKIRVHAKYQDGTVYEDVFDTVMFAVGREA